jgi:hypothetical protein
MGLVLMNKPSSSCLPRNLGMVFGFIGWQGANHTTTVFVAKDRAQ